MKDKQQKQADFKHSIQLTKFRTPEFTPIKGSFKDNHIAKDSQTIQFRDAEEGKTLHKVDLNTKMDGLSNEITILKEKLTDIHLSNTHLKHLLREKTPSKSMTRRPQFTINDQQQQLSQHQLPLKAQFNSENSMRQTYLKSSCINSNSDSLYTNGVIKPKKENSNSKEEVIKMEKKIEQLKEKSKKLESLVITLENKLDKPNSLLPNIRSKAKENHCLYDETKQENEKIRHQANKYSKDSGTLEYCLNQSNLPQELISIDDYDDNYHQKSKKEKDEIESLTNINKSLKEDREQLKKTINEMKTNRDYLMPFKIENDKLITELSKIREDNSGLRLDLAHKANSIAEMANEIKDIKSNSKRVEKGYYNQTSGLTKDKEHLMNDNKRLRAANASLEKKSKEDSDMIIRHSRLSEEMQDQIDSLNTVIRNKEDALINLNDLLNKLETEKTELNKKAELLSNRVKETEDIIESDNQKSKQQFEVFRSEQNEKNNQIMQYEKEIETLKQTIVAQTNDNSKLKIIHTQNQESHERNNNDLKMKLAQYEEKYSNLCMEKKSEAERFALSHDDKDKEIVQLKAKIKENEDNAINSKSTIADLSQRNNNLQSEIGNLKNANASKGKETEQLSEAVQKLEEQLKESENNLDTQSRLNEVSSKKHNEEAVRKDKEIEENKNAIAEKDCAINKMIQETENQNKELNEIIKSKDNEVSQLLKENKAINIQLSNLKGVIKDKETEEKKDEMCINDILSNYGITEDALTKLENDNADSDKDYPSALRFVDKIKIRNYLLERKVKKYALSLSELNDIKQTQLASDQELTAKKEEIAYMTRIINDNNELKDKTIEEQKAIIAQLTNDTQILKLEANAIQSQLDCELNSKSILLNSKEDLLKQFNQLKESFSNLESSKIELQEQFVQDKAETETKLTNLLLSSEHDKEELNKTLEESSKTIKSLMTKNATKTKEINDHKKTIEKKDLEIKAIQKENLDLTDDVLTAQSKVTEAQNRLKKQQMVNDQNEEAAKSKLKQMADAVKEKEDQITGLKTQLEIKTKDNEKLIMKHPALDDQIKDLNRIIQLKDEGIQRKEEEMAVIFNDKDAKMSVMETIMKDLRLENDNKDKVIKQINADLNEKIEELIEKKELYTHAKQELDMKIEEISLVSISKANIEQDYSNDIKELQTKNEMLLLKINQSNQTLSEKDAIINHLENDVESLNKAVNDYKAIVISKEDSYQDKEAEILKMNKELKDQAAVLIKANAQNINESIKEINQLNIKESEISELKRKNESNENEVKALQDKLKEKADIIFATQLKINESQHDIDQLSKIKDEYNSIKDSNEQLSHSNKEYEDKSKYKDNVIQEQQKEIIELTDANKNLSTRITRIDTQHQQAIATLSQESQGLKDQLAILQEELTKSTLASSELEATHLLEVQALAKEVHLKQQEVIQLTNAITAKNSQYEKEILYANALKGEVEQLQLDINACKINGNKNQIDVANIKAQAKLNEDKANEEISQLKAQDRLQKAENDKLTAQLLILTSNSTKCLYNKPDQQLNEAIQLLQTKEEESKKLNSDLSNIKIELKAVRDEYDSLSLQIVNLKEAIVQKDIAMQDKEDSHTQLIEEIAKLKDEHQLLETSKEYALSIEVDKLANLLSEKETELQNYQKINDKLIQVNQELSEKVNLEAIEIQKEGTKAEAIANKEEEELDRDEYMSLVMKNDSLNELIRSKEEEITALKKELEHYKNEVTTVMAYENECLGNKGKDSSSLVTSFNQSDDANKLQETIVKIKTAYKDKHNEVQMLQQQLCLLKGDIKNYQSKADAIQKEFPQIEDCASFKMKVISVLHDYKPKKKDQIELVKQLKKDLGEEEGNQVSHQGTEKKKGLLNFMKNK